jgi:hypothetical protein
VSVPDPCAIELIDPLAIHIATNVLAAFVCFSLIAGSAIAIEWSTERVRTHNVTPELMLSLISAVAWMMFLLDVACFVAFIWLHYINFMHDIIKHQESLPKDCHEIHSPYFQSIEFDFGTGPLQVSAYGA